MKTQFLDLIINANCSIKKVTLGPIQAAEILNINYSSSKSIISEFRKESAKAFKPKQSRNLRVAEWREVGRVEEPVRVLGLFTSVGRKEVSGVEVVIQPQVVKKVKIFHILPLGEGSGSGY